MSRGSRANARRPSSVSLNTGDNAAFRPGLIPPERRSPTISATQLSRLEPAEMHRVYDARAPGASVILSFAAKQQSGTPEPPSNGAVTKPLSAASPSGAENIRSRRVSSSYSTSSRKPAAMLSARSSPRARRENTTQPLPGSRCARTNSFEKAGCASWSRCCRSTGSKYISSSTSRLDAERFFTDIVRCSTASVSCSATSTEQDSSPVWQRYFILSRPICAPYLAFFS